MQIYDSMNEAQQLSLTNWLLWETIEMLFREHDKRMAAIVGEHFQRYADGLRHAMPSAFPNDEEQNK
jgi:hypothetical protein